MKKSIFQKLDDLHPIAKAGLFSFVPTFLAWLLIVLVGTYDVKTEAIKGTLTVVASWHLVFIENRIVWVEILALVLSFVFPIWYAHKYGGVSAGTGEYSGGHVYWITWVVAVAFMIMPFAFKNNNTGYKKIVDEKTFQYLEKNKDKIDSFFVK